MAKLTTNEIEQTKVVRATFLDGRWVVLVSDEKEYIYRVIFEGEETDDNSIILSNTHNELLNVEKHEEPIILKEVTRDNINGLNPIG